MTVSYGPGTKVRRSIHITGTMTGANLNTLLADAKKDGVKSVLQETVASVMDLRPDGRPYVRITDESLPVLTDFQAKVVRAGNTYGLQVKSHFMGLVDSTPEAASMMGYDASKDQLIFYGGKGGSTMRISVPRN